MILLLIVIMIGCAIAGSLVYINKECHRFAKGCSVAIKKLDELNKKYRFLEILNFDQKHIYDNEIMYNEISCLDYLVYQLQFIKSDVSMQISRAKANKNRYDEYCKNLETIREFGNFTKPACKILKHIILTIEKRLFNQNTLRPKTDFNIKICLYRSNINGVISNKKDDIFGSEQIKSLISRLCNKCGNFYRDRDIWDSICRVERGKVSNKMRFAIYERDGYRCCKCGVSEEYANLEIDHIKPISKGGKSTFDNLQTLCHQCNVEKGDTWVGCGCSKNTYRSTRL